MRRFLPFCCCPLVFSFFVNKNAWPVCCHAVAGVNQGCSHSCLFFSIANSIQRSQKQSQGGVFLRVLRHCVTQWHKPMEDQENSIEHISKNVKRKSIAHECRAHALHGSFWKLLAFFWSIWMWIVFAYCCWSPAIQCTRASALLREHEEEKKKIMKMEESGQLRLWPPWRLFCSCALLDVQFLKLISLLSLSWCSSLLNIATSKMTCSRLL